MTMPIEDAGTYLRSKALNVHRAGGSEVTLHCLWCPDGDPKGKGKLYVNTESWLFDCKRCGTRGGKKALLEFFGDEYDEKTWEPGKDPARRRRVLEEFVTTTEGLLLANEPMMLYLLRRGLRPETIDEARLGYAPRNTALAASLPSSYKEGGFTRDDLVGAGILTERGTDFLSGKIVIPYIVGGNIVQVRGKDPDGKYFTPSGDNVLLYGADELRGADVAFVSEGEFDRWMVKQALRDAGRTDVAVVGLPGAGSWPGGADGFQDYFEGFKRVYLGFDPDDTGKREATKAKALLGAKARLVELPNSKLTDSMGEEVKCDWTEYLRPLGVDHPYGGHTAADVLALMADADMAGKRMFSMYDAGAKWKRSQQETPGIRLGWPSLDAIIKPGLKPGNLMIPLAKTGTGKTVFLGNIAWNTRATPTLLITMEQLAQEVYEILRRIARFHHPRFDDPDIQAAFPLLRIVDENRLRREDFALLVQEYEDELGLRPQQVMVDYLGYYAKGQPGGSPYEKTSNAVMQLKEEAKTHALGIIAPHQVSRGAKDGKPFDADDARDSGVVEETADFLFGLFKPGESQDDQRVQGIVSEALGAQILKSRRGGKGRVVHLAMSMMSLAIVDGSDRRNVNRVQMENAHYNRGEHYDDYYKAVRAAEDEKFYAAQTLDLQITGEKQ